MTDRRPEATHAVPIVAGSLRASDADRDQVAAVLSTAYAEGRLTREEHDERLDRVLAAKTFDDLIPITHDLVVVPPAPNAALAPHPSATYAIDSTSASDEVDTMVAVFGAVNRKGKWRVHKRSKASAPFRGIELDMREAIFEAPVVEISGIWCFSGLNITVPAGIEVRDQTAGIFGGTDVRDVGDAQSGAPVLVIKGMTIFGGVSVHGPSRLDKK